MLFAPTTLLLQFRKWKHISTAMLLGFLSLVQHQAQAQNGHLKFKGVIENVDEYLGRSLITLSKIQSGSGPAIILGQFVVEGNSWVRTSMEYGKTYMLEVSSNNGTTKRYLFITNVPLELTGRTERMVMPIDMSMTVQNLWTPQATGSISYSDAAQKFTQRESTQSEKLRLAGHACAPAVSVQGSDLTTDKFVPEHSTRAVVVLIP